MDAGRGCGNLASLSGGPVSRQRRSGPGADHPCRRNSGPLRRGEFGHISRLWRLLRTAHFTDAHGQFVLEGLPPERTMLWIHPYFVPTAHFFSTIEPGADDIHHALVWPVVEAGRIVDVGEITVTSHPGGPQVTFPRRSRVELAAGLLLGLGCQSEQSAVPRPTTLPAPAPPAPTPPEEPATNYLVPGFTGLYFTPGEPLLLTEGSTVLVDVTGWTVTALRTCGCESFPTRRRANCR